MPVDPLSPATRNTKRNLLIVSALAITYRTFEVTIDKLPIAGIVVKFDPRIFAFLLTITLLYFTLTFVLYYYIDIRNIEETPHQAQMPRLYQEKVGLYSRRVASKIKNAILAKLPSQHRFGSDDHLYELFDYVEKQRLIDILMWRIELPLGLVEIGETKQKSPLHQGYVRVHPDKNPNLFLELERTLKPHLRVHWLKARLNRARYGRQRWTVRVAYPFRNYVLDGLFPLAMAALAFGALYHWIGLRWLHSIAPAN